MKIGGITFTHDGAAQMQVVAYIRFSSDRQADGRSVARQLEDTAKFCRRHDLTLTRTIIDRGVSAFRGRNATEGGLADFIAEVKAGKVEEGSMLIIEHFDRMDRRPLLIALSQFLTLINAGLRIAVARFDRIYDANSHTIATDLNIALNAMSEANNSSLDKGERVADAWREKRKLVCSKPLTRMCPAWLDASERDGTITFRPNAGADTVRRIFREAASGLGCYSISKRLQTEGVPTLTGNRTYSDKHDDPRKAGKPVGNGWNKSRVREIIRSDTPLGWFQPHRWQQGERVPDGEPVKGYYPAIVDQATADRARANIASRAFHGMGSGRKGDVISNVFSMVARCGVCGANMHLCNRIVKLGQAGYLRCSAAFKDADSCSNRSGFRIDKLEAAVIRDHKLIRKLVQAMPINDPSRAIKGTIADKTAEADRLEASISRMAEAFGTAPDLPVLAAQLQQLGERHQAIMGELDELNKQLAAAEHDLRPIEDLEQRYITTRMQAQDPAIVRKARAELAGIIRKTFKDGILCLPNKQVVMWQVDKLSARYDADFDLSAYVGMPDNPMIAIRLMSQGEFREQFAARKMVADGSEEITLRPTDPAWLAEAENFPREFPRELVIEVAAE